MAGFRAFLGAALLAALAGCSAPPPLVSAPLAPAAPDPTWAFEASDLPVDPGYRFGQLPNGMRYVVRQNARPEGTALVRMVIEAGSLDEREEERGFAHFVEHMAFNGSTNVPEGEMVSLLERNGLAFGADTNASTGFEQTQYKLNLPRNTPDLLDTALMLMRETAGELSFDPDAVARERGVVLSELRDGLTYARRDFEDRMAFFFPDTRLVDRLPIGTADTLNAATAEALRGFWEREYTPADTTLIVVGDYDPDGVEAAIRARFADWQPREPTPRAAPGSVDPKRRGLTDIYIDQPLSERLTISRNGAYLNTLDTAANRRENTMRQIGYGIVNRRMLTLARQADPPFIGAGLGTSDVFKVARATQIVVDTVDRKWERGLTAAAREYRRALQFGFTTGEVAEQVAQLRENQENAAASAATRSNAALTNGAIALVTDDVVPTTPETSLQRFEGFAQDITPAAVLAALRREAVDLTDPLIRFQGRSDPAGGAAAIRALWNKVAREPVTRGDEGQKQDFAYTDFGPAGTVVADTIEPRLGIREVRFANNVRLNLKRTDLERDRVQISVAIDGGDMLNTRENPRATDMVGFFSAGGLGKHSEDELQSILAGRTISGQLVSAGDTFQINAPTTLRDLELQLQVLAAYLSDPGFRREGEERYRLNINNVFARLNATPQSALRNSQGAILSDDDPRFSVGKLEEYRALTFAQLEAAIGDRLAEGAIEIGIVGDIDGDAVIALVAKTFGALPQREADFGSWEEARQRNFTTRREMRTVRHEGDASQAIVQFQWPTRDGEDPVELLELEMLERVTRIELTDGLREKLGKTYSPGASSSASRTWPDYGTFTIAASVDVTDIAPTRDAILEIVSQLRGAPVDGDIFTRARAPLIEAFDNALKSNRGWLALVDRAQTKPDQIDRQLRAHQRVMALTPADVLAMARRYLDPAQAVEILVLPQGVDPPTEPDES